MHVTQQQIAELAGVSRATVDRVLKNRGKVNPDVAMRILKIVEELGYRPNRAGALLVRSKRPILLGVVIQSIETPFMAKVLQIINDFRQHFLEQGTELIIMPNAGFDCEHQLAAINHLLKQNIDGLALTPVIDERISDKINELVDCGIPVVSFNTDIPGSKRLCYVGQDGYQSGLTCASLMVLLLGGKGTVLPISGRSANYAHQQRIDGFFHNLRHDAPQISLLPLEYNHDDPRETYEIVMRVLQKKPMVNGIYFSANGQAGACQAICELNLCGHVHIVCHDLIETNTVNVREGLIDFLIDQNAQMQAVEPLNVLINYILSGIRPAKSSILTHIDIRNRYNIDS